MSWWHAVDTNPDKAKNRGQIWIYSKNWFYARQFSWTVLGLMATIRQSSEPPPSAFKRRKVYKGNFVGNAGGGNSNLEYKFELAKDRGDLIVKLPS